MNKKSREKEEIFEIFWLVCFQTLLKDKTAVKCLDTTARLIICALASLLYATGWQVDTTNLGLDILSPTALFLIRCFSYDVTLVHYATLA